MMQYDLVIMQQREVEKVLGERIEFLDGFVRNQKVDWWGELEKYLGKIIVSVRPSGRPGWDEVLIVCAKGTIKNNKHILDYPTVEEIKDVLHDIFCEAENDEYEVFESYSATCPKMEWKKVEEWVKETY